MLLKYFLAIFLRGWPVNFVPVGRRKTELNVRLQAQLRSIRYLDTFRIGNYLLSLPNVH